LVNIFISVWDDQYMRHGLFHQYLFGGQMYGYSLLQVFNALQGLGLVETRRQFSVRYLGRGSGYLLDHQRRVAGGAWVSPATLARLRVRLLKIAVLVPPGIAAEIADVIAVLDRGIAVAELLSR
jgi:hypothetical protein